MQAHGQKACGHKGRHVGLHRVPRLALGKGAQPWLQGFRVSKKQLKEANLRQHGWWTQSPETIREAGSRPVYMRVVLVGTEASEVDRTNCGEKGGSCQKPRDEARSSSGRSMRAMSASSPRGEPQVNRMQQWPALRMKRGSKGHGRVLSPRENTSETRAGPSATSLPPLPACLLDFVFPAFTVCVSLPFLGFEGEKN